MNLHPPEAFALLWSTRAAIQLPLLLGGTHGRTVVVLWHLPWGAVEEVRHRDSSGYQIIQLPRR